MANQIGKNRLFTNKDEANSTLKQTCTKCKVSAVPRGITSTKKTAPGEKHCPNCGHIYGRVKGS